MKLGVHISIAGNFAGSPRHAKELGCNAMQFFARNPRMLRKEHHQRLDAAVFKKEARKCKINPVVIHAPYLMNLASSSESFHKTTIRELTEDLIEADKLGAHYFVSHMGSHKGISEREGLLKITQALKSVLDETSGIKTMLLLENTSGSGNWLGYKFSHFNFIFERLKWPDTIGICLDTAHAYAAGYKIDSLQGLEDMLLEIKQEAGVERVKLIHLNDTKEKLNSRHDRHCDIGAGNIGNKGFYFILNHPKFKNIPLILETPKDGDEDDLRNLEAVRRIYSSLEYDRLEA